jgi:phage tail-like protein
MARRSFTLQKVTPNIVRFEATTLPASTTYFGSYTKYPAGAGAASADILSTGLALLEDDDTRLKSDNLLIAPILSNPTKSGSLLPYISFFEAEVTDYNEIYLSWDAPLNDLNDPILIASPDTVVATGIVIVHSYDGEPQTINDGNILVSDNNSTIYYHQVPSGSWSYYTLFVKFESNYGDRYYEPAAKIGVLTPRKYNSVDELYARVPEYYRLLDGNMDEGFGGPLYRYLSIFGYELDTVRTIVDHLMVMKDPQVANSQVLDYISQDLGVGLRVHELGASRLRALINIIGYLRRSEGTKSALELAIQALTGSDVEIDEEYKEVKVYAQRVNLLKDPNIKVSVAGVVDGGFYSTESFNNTLLSGFYNTPEEEYSIEIDGGSPEVELGSNVFTGQEPSWTFEPDVTSGGSVSTLMTYAESQDPPPPVPARGDYLRVKSGDKLYFSMQKDPTSGVQDQLLRVRLMWDAGSGGPGVLNGEGLDVVAESNTYTVIAGINYWELEVVEGYEDYINVFFFVDVPSTVDATESFGQLLLEREIGGLFFDGDTSFGGWLVDGDTISDYRWFNEESPNSSVEPAGTNHITVYNSNYSKTRAVVQRMLSSYLPITELTTGTSPIYFNDEIPDPKWIVTFNHVPGVY